ncbi:MAG TPA: DJ-1/PfpI family protein [Candidatus Omnitrophota bacterium]|nr:DJ-1/PfpI family protein [Candidatus Omnitrophota bacterium]HRZ14163.1 DJ-1/PfpI family protein [Candidatus Omnitrophota bacterium]
MKKALLILAQKDFRDEEYLQPKEILRRGGVAISTACSSLKPARGKLGAVVQPDIALADARAGDYDAVVFVGGNGARQYWDDPVAHALVREAAAQGKIIGAICIAPVILARAGVLKDKKATVWASEEGQIRKYGAIYTGADVQRDGIVITGAGPFASEEFGRELAGALK